jgi:PAS domain S-box-containing protein
VIKDHLSSQNRALVPSKSNMDLLKKDFILRTIQLAQANVWIYDVVEDHFEYSIPESTAFNYTAGEIPDTLDAWLKKLHPDDVEKIQGQINAVLSGYSNRLSYDHRLEDKDGDYVWVDVKGEVVESKPDGTPLKIIGFTQVIQNQKGLAQKLADSEHTFRTAADNAHEAIFITESNGNLSFANREMTRLSGFSNRALVGMQSLDLVAPEDREKVALNITKRLEGIPAPASYQCHLLRKDCSKRLVEVRATRIELPSGKVQVITQLLDITPLREAQEDIKKYQSDYKAIFDSSHEAIFVHDKDTGQILDVNQRMLEMFGVTKKEALEGNLDGVVATDEPQFSPDRAVKKVRLAARGTSQAFEWKTRRKSGETFWAEVHLRLVNLAGVERVLAFVSDITQRKQSEEEQRKLELQLRQTQKMEAIGTLAGGIAHDFNNILCGMLGYAELAELKSAQGRPIKEDLQRVTQAGIRARELVQQILAFSRRSEEEKIASDLTPIVREVSKLLRASLPASIEMRLDLQAKEALVLANPVNIHQVVMNLCTNAAHAMPDGGVLKIGINEVEVSAKDATLHPGLQPGPHVRLVVEDNGQGMNAEVRERIFDPFFTTKDPGKGTGMGMSVVHGIVKESGGSVSVYSEPDKGTKIIVLMPKAHKMTEAVAEIKEGLPKGHGRILLVDDELTVADAAAEMLTILGYQVSSFNESTAALDDFRAHSNDYDLLLTDLTMPEMNGLELTSQVHELRPDLPVLLWSGLGDQLREVDLDSLGINGVVLKPPLIHELAEQVQKAMELTQ